MDNENNKNLQLLLKEKFDICYVLNLSNRNDRRINMETLFNEMLFDNINTSSWLRYHFTTKFPYNDLIINAFNTTNKGRFTKPNEFDCSRNHYQMIRECYDRGFNNILIMEDDIKFLKNTLTFIDFIDNIPSDYDLLQFGGFTVDPGIKYEVLDKFNEGEYWVKHRNIPVWNASMYALSRKGMSYYIAFMDKFFWVADGPLYKAPINDKLINSYISTIPIVILEDKNIMLSDIRDKENDTIDYNNANMYESMINRNDYF